MISPGYRSLDMARRDSEDVVVPPTERRAGEPNGQGWPPGWTLEGVIAVLEPLALERRRARLQSVADGRLTSVTVVLDAPHDPHNGAAVMRSCDAFGIQRIHVVPRNEPFVVSSGIAKGTERWVDVIVHDGPEQAASTLRAEGFELVATHPAGELYPEDLSRIDRLALILGNEHDGIREPLATAAARTVRIPMRGFVESLNVSVSAAILLWAATRGRTSGDLTPGEKRAFYARGLLESVPRARDILAASPAR